MALAAGRLRHRISIQRPLNTQDPVTGEMSLTWEDVATNVAAEIAPLSVKEFIASQQMQSDITTRIVIRHRRGLTADMRILHSVNVYARDSAGNLVPDSNGSSVVDHVDTTVYNPHGFLADADIGLEYLTIPCSTGASDTGA